MANVEERVRNVTAKVLGLEVEQVTPNSSFLEDLSADSLDIVEVIIALEEEFGVDIPDEKAERMVTVQHVIDCISEVREINEQE